MGGPARRCPIPSPDRLLHVHPSRPPRPAALHSSAARQLRPGHARQPHGRGHELLVHPGARRARARERRHQHGPHPGTARAGARREVARRMGPARPLRRRRGRDRRGAVQPPSALQPGRGPRLEEEGPQEPARGARSHRPTRCRPVPAEGSFPRQARAPRRRLREGRPPALGDPYPQGNPGARSAEPDQRRRDRAHRREPRSQLGRRRQTEGLARRRVRGVGRRVRRQARDLEGARQGGPQELRDLHRRRLRGHGARGRGHGADECLLPHLLPVRHGRGRRLGAEDQPAHLQGS